MTSFRAFLRHLCTVDGASAVLALIWYFWMSTRLAHLAFHAGTPGGWGMRVSLFCVSVLLGWNAGKPLKEILAPIWRHRHADHVPEPRR